MVILQNSNQNRAQQQAQEQLAKQQSCQAAKPEEGRVFTKPEPQTFDKGSITELRSEDVTVGTGKEVTSPSACVTVHYLGNTADGTVFDNSYDRGEPIAFTLDAVIEGWKEGMIGMKEGGTRRLYIPSDKAYGEAGAGGTIGPNEPLYFSIELIKVQ
ncbi:peptidylprolyl isomerase [Candidatus Saccharibacteria bacterium]|nr:MAG: peptidylprolyl isomerase [Candidatus Saccharibacteria bacterium]